MVLFLYVPYLQDNSNEVLHTGHDVRVTPLSDMGRAHHMLWNCHLLWVSVYKCWIVFLNSLWEWSVCLSDTRCWTILAINLVCYIGSKFMGSRVLHLDSDINVVRDWKCVLMPSALNTLLMEADILKIHVYRMVTLIVWSSCTWCLLGTTVHYVGTEPTSLGHHWVVVSKWTCNVSCVV